MRINWDNVRIFIMPGITDMRNQINGLSALVEEMKHDPLNGNLYLFCNRNRRRLKILYWDKNGLCMWLKRLEQDRFPWPKDKKECRELSVQELDMLLNGINFFNAYKKLNFSAAS